MTKERKENLQKLAKGTWQAEVLNDLLSGYEVTNPISNLRGNAKSYSGRYQISFDNLLFRLQKAGIKIHRTPGPRGGEWSATYKITA